MATEMKDVPSRQFVSSKLGELIKNLKKMWDDFLKTHSKGEAEVPHSTTITGEFIQDFRTVLGVQHFVESQDGFDLQNEMVNSLAFLADSMSISVDIMTEEHATELSGILEKLSRGVLNYMSKDAKKTCGHCAFGLPTYVGRDPKHCPNCGGAWKDLDNSGHPDCCEDIIITLDEGFDSDLEDIRNQVGNRDKLVKALQGLSEANCLSQLKTLNWAIARVTIQAESSEGLFDAIKDDYAALISKCTGEGLSEAEVVGVKDFFLRAPVDPEHNPEPPNPDIPSHGGGEINYSGVVAGSLEAVINGQKSRITLSMAGKEAFKSVEDLDTLLGALSGQVLQDRIWEMSENGFIEVNQV